MGDSFTVNVDEMRRHANTVANIASQVNAACNAASSSVGGNSYGVIGQFFAAALMSASELVRDGLIKGSKSFTDVHNGLREVADLYQKVDQAQAQLFAVTRGDARR